MCNNVVMIVLMKMSTMVDYDGVFFFMVNIDCTASLFAVLLALRLSFFFWQ